MPVRPEKTGVDFFAGRLIVKPADRGNFDRKDDPYEKKNIYGCCGCFGRCIFDGLRRSRLSGCILHGYLLFRGGLFRGGICCGWD